MSGKIYSEINKKSMINNGHRGKILDKKNNFEVIDCERCGFKHAIPIPSDKELEEFYGKEFYSRVKPKYFSDYEEDLEWWMAAYRNHYNLLAKHTVGRRLLDIGSGPGYFLKCGREMGWDVLGFEPSKDAAEYSSKLGVEVVNDFFPGETIKKYGKFDAIYMKTVIEHIPDPEKLLRDAKNALVPGGVLCIISPNDYNPLQKILRENLGFEPWWVSPPQHINYFDFKSIQSVLIRQGLSVVDSLGTFPMEFFLLSGINYIGDAKVGRQCQSRRKIFELNMSARNPDILNDIYRFLGAKNIGREFILIAKKPLT